MFSIDTHDVEGDGQVMNSATPAPLPIPCVVVWVPPRGLGSGGCFCLKRSRRARRPLVPRPELWASLSLLLCTAVLIASLWVFVSSSGRPGWEGPHPLWQQHDMKPSVTSALWRTPHLAEPGTETASPGPPGFKVLLVVGDFHSQLKAYIFHQLNI